MKLRRVPEGLIAEHRSGNWVPLQAEGELSAERAGEMVAFLAGGDATRAAAEEQLAGIDDDRAESIAVDPGTAGLPFQPRSMRAFMLWEDHVIASSRMLVKRFFPPPVPKIVKGFEKVTGKTFPKLKPNARFYETTRLNIRVARLDIVELYQDSAISAVYALRQIPDKLGDVAARMGTLLVCNPELQQGEGMRQRLFDAGGQSYWPRLLVTDADRDDSVAPHANAETNADVDAEATPTSSRVKANTRAPRTGITTLLNDMAASGLVLRDVRTRQSSLEEIFVGLVSGDAR